MTREEFEKTFCFGCGSQRCYGFGSETAMGCQHYKTLILGEQEEQQQDDFEAFMSRVRHVLANYDV